MSAEIYTVHTEIRKKNTHQAALRNGISLLCREATHFCLSPKGQGFKEKFAFTCKSKGLMFPDVIDLCLVESVSGAIEKSQDDL